MARQATPARERALKLLRFAETSSRLEERYINPPGALMNADNVRFLVNKTEVSSQPAAGVDGAGIAGLRVNHNLNVHVDGFGVK